MAGSDCIKENKKPENEKAKVEVQPYGKLLLQNPGSMYSGNEKRSNKVQEVLREFQENDTLEESEKLQVRINSWL